MLHAPINTYKKDGDHSEITTSVDVNIMKSEFHQKKENREIEIVAALHCYNRTSMKLDPYVYETTVCDFQASSHNSRWTSYHFRTSASTK